MIPTSFLLQLSSFWISFIVMLFMLVFFYVGARLRKYIIKINKEDETKSLGAVEGSLLGLLALLLSFTFSMSSSRHDNRIRIIVEEADCISSAVLRADLYPDSIRAAFRKDFKAYLESRIEFFEAGIDTARIYKSLKSSSALQHLLWKRASKLGQDRDNFHRSSQMIPALTAMIDVVSRRNAANLNKVPELIIYLLFLLCFSGAFMLGYASGKKLDWTMLIGFVGMISIAIFMIIDLDRPRRGFIGLKDVNLEIVKLREMFEANE